MSLNSSKLTIIITIFAFFDLHPQYDYFIKIQLYIKYMIIMIETRSHINKASKWNICLDNHAFQQSCQNYSHWKNDSPVRDYIHPDNNIPPYLYVHSLTVLSTKLLALTFPILCCDLQLCRTSFTGNTLEVFKKFSNRKKGSLLLR